MKFWFEIIVYFPFTHDTDRIENGNVFAEVTNTNATGHRATDTGTTLLVLLRVVVRNVFTQRCLVPRVEAG
jgi:hypothetical protein